MHSVVGIGWALCDSVMMVPDYPDENTKTPAMRAFVQAGGPVVRAMLGLARLKVATSVVASVGDDRAGAVVLSELRRAGVDVAGIRTESGCRTRNGHVWLSEESGTRTIVYSDDGHALSGLPAAGRTAIRDAGVLHADARETAAFLEAVSLAREVGASVSIDVGSPKAHLPTFLAHADLVFVPARTLDVITTGSTVEAKLDEMFAYGPRTVVVTRGEAGAEAFHLDGERHSVVPPQVRVVDSNGAGDVFAAGYIYGILCGWSRRRRLTFAAAFAAAKCAGLGNTAIPGIDEVLAMEGATA